MVTFTQSLNAGSVLGFFARLADILALAAFIGSLPPAQKRMIDLNCCSEKKELRETEL
jgi:hypothetical protein